MHRHDANEHQVHQRSTASRPATGEIPAATAHRQAIVLAWADMDGLKPTGRSVLHDGQERQQVTGALVPQAMIWSRDVNEDERAKAGVFAAARGYRVYVMDDTKDVLERARTCVAKEWAGPAQSRADRQLGAVLAARVADDGDWQRQVSYEMPSHRVAESQRAAELLGKGFSRAAAMEAGAASLVEHIPVVGGVAGAVREYQSIKAMEQQELRSVGGLNAVSRELDRHESRLGRHDAQIAGVTRIEDERDTAMRAMMRVVLALADGEQPSPKDEEFLRQQAQRVTPDRSTAQPAIVGYATTRNIGN